MNGLFFALTIPIWIASALLACGSGKLFLRAVSRADAIRHRWHVWRAAKEYRKFVAEREAYRQFEAQMETGAERNRKMLETIARYPDGGAA